MPTTSEPCPSCGGTNFAAGKLEHKPLFMPEGSSLFTFGFAVRARLCLTCGTLVTFIDAEDLTAIKAAKYIESTP